nr:hypothetical protein Iba_chr10fCG10990 [Ipomoea batatas]
MENHKVSRFFPSSFTSCRLRTLTDVVQSSISATRNRHENQFPKINLAGAGDADHRVGTRDFGYHDKKTTSVLAKRIGGLIITVTPRVVAGKPASLAGKRRRRGGEDGRPVGLL